MLERAGNLAREFQILIRDGSSAEEKERRNAIFAELTVLQQKVNVLKQVEATARTFERDGLHDKVTAGGVVSLPPEDTWPCEYCGRNQPVSVTYCWNGVVGCGAARVVIEAIPTRA